MVPSEDDPALPHDAAETPAAEQPESIPIVDLPDSELSPIRVDGVDYFGLTRPTDSTDVRVYVREHADWEASVKRDSTKVYCYARNPGEDFFHLILMGEVYLIRGDEKYCLKCALRQGVVTRDRLFWQRHSKTPRPAN